MNFKVDENTDIFKYTNNFNKYRNIKSKLITGSLKTKAPLISIVIPTYNRASLLKESIDSAINQIDYNDYEIIVVDNESYFDTDTATEKLLKSYNNDKLFYYKNEKNIGMYGNWNRGIELSRGKFISLLHDDDTLCDNYLYSIVKVIKHCNFKGIIGVNCNIIGLNNNFEKTNNDKFEIKKFDFKEFYLGNDINIGGLTFYKKYAVNIGGFSDYGDFVFRINFVKKYNAINIKKNLVNYRIFQNESLNKETIIETIVLVYYIRKKLLNFSKIYKIFDSIFYKEYLFQYIEGAKKYWNININKDYIFEKIGIKNHKIIYVKYYFMNFILKVLKKIMF